MPVLAVVGITPRGNAKCSPTPSVRVTGLVGQQMSDHISISLTMQQVGVLLDPSQMLDQILPLPHNRQHGRDGAKWQLGLTAKPRVSSARLFTWVFVAGRNTASAAPNANTGYTVIANLPAPGYATVRSATHVP